MFDALVLYESGDLPRFEEDERQRADGELNEVYKAVMTSDFGSSTVRPSGIRETEKKWLSYRTAWADLGTARYPSSKRSSWETWVTKERILQLRDLQSTL